MGVNNGCNNVRDHDTNSNTTSCPYTSEYQCPKILVG